MDARPAAGGPDPIDVAVGYRLRQLRKSSGMSQETLARSLGVTFQQVQKYDRGTNRISASMLVKASRALGVTADAILPDDQAPTPTTPAILSMIATLRGVDDLIEAYGRIGSPRLRRAVLRLARSLAAG